MMSSLRQFLLLGLLAAGCCLKAGLTSAAPSEVAAPVLPRPGPSSYVVAQDGHFFLAGQRIRFWGINLQAGAFPSYQEISHLADRVARLGVNAVRMWPTQGTFYQGRSLAEKRFPQGAMKNGSLLDRYDFFVSELKRNGIFIQNPALHYVDIDAIRQWPDADVRNILGPNPTPGDIRKLHGIAPYLSAGWEAMLTTHIRNYLGHINPYTQRPYSDEPIFSGWELANESQFVHCMLRQACVSGLPPALHDQLTVHWQEWWKAKHGQIGVGLPVFDGDWDRSVKSSHADYRKFIHDRFVLVSQRLEGVARGMAPAGKGIAVQPITYSTQAGDPLLVARAAYSAGDYSTIGAYQTPLDRNQKSPFFPFRLNLASPVFYNFNYGAVQGKPTVVYENSFFRPYPYRAEWPWAMLYLAAVQDWDALFLYTYGQPWAIYGKGPDGEPHYGDKPLPTPSDVQDAAPRGVYVGLHHGGDEVGIAAWAAAGLAFLGGELASGEEALVYPFTQPQIFGPAPGYCLFPGCGAGAIHNIADMNSASLGRPIRLRWTDESKPLPVKQTSVSPSQTLVSGEMTLARAMPQLRIDAARSKVVAGVLEGEVRFKDGFAVRFPRRQFGFVSLSSADGRGLASSRSIRVFAAGKSSNSGLVFDPQDVDFKRATGVVKGVRKAGQAPIVFDRPEFTLVLPNSTARFERFDFNLDAYQTASGDLSIGSNEPFFTGIITE